MATQKGIVKKTAVKAFIHFKNKPIIAINLDQGDTLKWVRKTSGNQDIVMVTSAAMAIRFEEEQIRELGRASRGVRGIKIREKDTLISMDVINREESKLNLFIITKYGFGKNIRVSEFRCQNRGGIGVKCLKFRKTISSDCVTDALICANDDEVMIVSQSGTLCRQSIQNISTQKRESQGVRIMKLDDKDKVIAISIVNDSEDPQAPLFE